MSDTKEEAPAPAKKGGKKKLLIGVVALVALVGGGVGAGVYAAQSGMIGGGHAKADAEDPNTPKLVPKSEEKHAAEGGEGGGEHGGGGGEGEGEATASHGEGKPTPEGHGGDQYASTYYPMEKEFTANLQNSVHFIQVGIAVSTPYDEKVIANLKNNDIAVRSVLLMALGDTPEEQVLSSQGKEQLQRRLAKAINDTLQQKEGFGGISNVYFTSFVVQ